LHEIVPFHYFPFAGLAPLREKILQTTKPARLHHAKADRIYQIRSVLLQFIHHTLRSLRLCESKYF